MYRYDEIDTTLVAERVAQFRDQTRRFLDGKLPEDEFRPLRLRNGLYIQKHAPMLRIADSLRPAVHAPAAHAGAPGAQVRPRLRAFHHAPEPAVQLAEARRRAGHAGRARHGRDARHPDQRQLHPQRHGRSLRRHRARRARGSAPVLRDHPPVVHAASGVHLPAAQVQDRRDRLAGGPRRFRGARHRPAHEARRRTARWASRCWWAAAWAARPSSARRSATSCRASTCCRTSRPSCASTTRKAGATTSTRRASRSW